MSMENLGAIHPKVKNALQELQGLTVDLVAGAALGINAAVVGIKPEDTILSALNNNAGTISAVVPSTLTIADGFARGSAVFLTVIATDEITVNALSYVGVAGAKASTAEFSVDTSDEAAVIDLADSINTRDGANVTAVANGDTLEITAVVEGTAGNAITFVSADSTITETGAGTLINATGVKATGTITAATVVAGDTVTLDGNTYTAVLAADQNTNSEFTFAVLGTDTLTAADLVRAINLRESRPGGGGNLTADNASAVVTVTATNFGTDANLIDLASSDGATLAVSAATLTGGLIVGGFIRGAAAFDQLMLTWFNKR